MSRRNFRQTILDVLHEKPGLTPQEVATHIKGIEIENLSKLMRSMADCGECKRERDESMHGKPYRYTALVNVPFKGAGGHAARGVATNWKRDQPWLTVNKCDDSRKPHPNQGGQGAVGGFFRMSMMLGETA